MLKIDDAELLSISAGRGRHMGINRIDHEHPILRDLFRRRFLQVTQTRESLDEDFANHLPRMLNLLVPNVTAEAPGLFPRIEREFMGDDLYRTRRVDTVRAFIPVEALSDLVAGVGGSFENEIRRLSYLGPLRSYPSKHLCLLAARRSKQVRGRRLCLGSGS